MRIILSACVLLFAFGPSAIKATVDESTVSLYETLDRFVPIAMADDTSMGRPLKATLSGDSEVPGPGDADGTGHAEVTLNLGQQEVCFELSVENIEAATLAHIHVGPVDESGGVVVTLDPPSTGESSGCVSDVPKDVIQAILNDPAGYYVNVHNADFPAGAVRGQLTKKAVGKESESM